LFKEALGEHWNLEEEEIQGAHDTALDQDWWPLRGLATDTSSRAAEHIRLGSGSRGDNETRRNTLVNAESEVVRVQFEYEVFEDFN